MPPRILCVAGPTACGKTRFSIELAKRYHGEVVSIDSMQIYKGMSIGTAAPTAEEMAAVPHHMVAVADPGEDWSAARFAEAADRCIQDILSRNRLPILAGGTGLYLDAVVSGRQFAPGSSGGAVRRELEAELAARGPAHMLERLRKADPLSAGRLHPADTKRILRALEVYLETGETISQHDRRTRDLPKRYDPVYLGLAFRDREDMKRLIDRRVDQMMAAGLPEEVRALLDRGVPPRATALQAIGYKELLPALAGERTLEEAAEEIKLRSRQYAKRQLTWLRRNPDIHWIFWEKERNFAYALQIATEILTREGLQ
jgi:tRNA dimethylallyltransferase